MGRSPSRLPYYITAEQITNWEEMAHYIIYTDGSDTVALDGDTGEEISRDTEPSTVVQAAMDGLPSTYGGLIGIKSSILDFSTTLDYPETKPCHLYGLGMLYPRLRLASSANCNLIECSPSSNVFFHAFTNLHFAGNNANNTSGSAIVFTDGGGQVKDLHMHQVLIDDFPDQAMNIDGFRGAHITDCVFERCFDGHGVQITGTTNPGTPTIDDMGTFLHCRFGRFDNNTGVFVDSPRTRFISCEVEHHGLHGMYFNKAGCQVIGGLVRRNSQDTSDTYSGIAIAAGGDNTQILGVHFDGFNNEKYNINVASGASDCIITGNYLMRAATAPIIDSGTDTLIHNNTGYVTENGGAAANINDGGTIAHGLSTTPVYASAVCSVAAEMASITGLDGTNITVAIKDDEGNAGTQQTIYWRAWV